MNLPNPNLLKKILKKENLRYTQQRQSIWDELCSSEEHRDAEEIYLSLKFGVLGNFSKDHVYILQLSIIKILTLSLDTAVSKNKDNIF